MKNLSSFFVFFLVAFLSIATMAQSPWILQRAIGLPNSVNPQVIFSAVDDNVCWGINFNNSQYLRTTNGGTNWTVSTIAGATGLHGSCISAIDVNIAFAALNDPSNATSGGIFKTTNGGTTWSKQTSAFSGSGGYPADIHFFDSNNGVVIGEPHNGNWEIYTTTNGGTQWIQVPSANIPPPASNTFTAGGLYASAGNYIWFGTWGPTNNTFAMYRSTDRGMTWSKFNVPGNVTFSVAFKDSMNGLAVDCFYLNGVNQIVRTTDGGATWTSLQNVPPTPSTYFISYAKGTSGSYVITSHENIGAPQPTLPGSSYSTDNGSTWHLVDNIPRNRIAFNSAYNGWSGGINDSVYNWDSDLLTSVKEINSIAESYNLEQNYPNPFNPSTTIRFQVPNSSFVNLKVYDILGNEVAALVNEEKSTGSYEIDFNGANLSSGIYLYTLQAGNYTQTKKLILMK